MGAGHRENPTSIRSPAPNPSALRLDRRHACGRSCGRKPRDRVFGQDGGSRIAHNTSPPKGMSAFGANIGDQLPQIISATLT